MEITAKADDVARIIGNALHFAGKDDTLPVLAAVRLECEAGTLAAVATDRYALGYDSASVDGDAAFQFLLDHRDAAKIVKASKEHGKAWRNVVGGPTVVIRVTDDTLTFEVPGQTFTATRVFGEFPRWRSLVPDAATLAAADGTNRVALALGNLARFAKVTAENRNAPARFYLVAATKGVVVKVGATFVGLLMPCRIDWACDAPEVDGYKRCTHSEGHAGDHSWAVSVPVAV